MMFRGKKFQVYQCLGYDIRDFFNLDFDRESERGNAVTNRLGIDSGVDERAQGHIAADAAEAIKMSYPHESDLLLNEFYSAPRYSPNARFLDVDSK